jgi:hypothetical protein
MATFRHKFEAGLVRRGVSVSNDPGDKCDALLIIAGTRHMLPLLKVRRRGIPVVQRLDGINWIHRAQYRARHCARGRKTTAPSAPRMALSYQSNSRLVGTRYGN